MSMDNLFSIGYLVFGKALHSVNCQVSHVDDEFKYLITFLNRAGNGIDSWKYKGIGSTQKEAMKDLAEQCLNEVVKEFDKVRDKVESIEELMRKMEE